MTIVPIPFFLRTVKGKNGSRRFGWVDVDVDVKEVDKSEVEHAVRFLSVCDLERCYFNAGDRYVFEGSFFENAHSTFARSTKNAFHEDHISKEVKLESVARRERCMITGAFNSRLLKKLGHQRVEMGYSRILPSVKSIDPSSLAEATEWAADQFILVDGVLMQKSDPVSLFLESGIGWTPIGSPVDISWCVHGLSSGLHFPYPTDDFIAMKHKITRKFGGSSDSWVKPLNDLIQSEVDRFSQAGQYAVEGRAIFNVDLLSRVTDDFLFEARSIASIARVISLELLSSRSAYKKTSWGERLVELEKTALEFGANLFGQEELLDEIADALDKIPRSLLGEYGAFILDSALERYADRAVVAPARVTGNKL